MLQNRIYLGEIRHKSNSYPGTHKAILDRELWEKVQAKLKENAYARRHGTNADKPSALRGLLYDQEGSRFTPSHAVKSGKRYRYYVSQKVIGNGSSAINEPARIPAREIERLVLSELNSFFVSADKVVEALAFPGEDVSITAALLQAANHLAKELEEDSGAALNELLVPILRGVIVRPESVELQLNRHAIGARLLSQQPEDADHDNNTILLTVPAELRRCRGEIRLIIPSSSQGGCTHEQIPSLLRAISRAHEWVRMIEAGIYKDQRDVAAATGLDERYISRILPAAFLAPDIVEAIVEGRQSPDLTLDHLLHNIPLSWNMQKP